MGEVLEGGVGVRRNVQKSPHLVVGSVWKAAKLTVCKGGVINIGDMKWEGELFSRCL